MATGPQPRMPEINLGPLTVHALVDGVAPVRKAAEMMLDAPDTLIDDHRDWLVPDYLDADTDRLLLAYQSFVVQTPDSVILIDCAVGEDGNYSSRPDWHQAKSDWLNHLGQAGLAPEDIDIVFLTHLHVDHTGWLTRKYPDGWRPTFAGARHLTTRVEHDFWTENHVNFGFMEQSVPDSVAPVTKAGLFEFVAPGDEIATGLFVVDLAGHSPGMVGLEYRVDGKVFAAFNADLMHHPLQMKVPGMSTRFCSDPEEAAAKRIRNLTKYAKDGTLMFCGHFPGFSAGHVHVNGDGFDFVPVRHAD